MPVNKCIGCLARFEVSAGAIASTKAAYPGENLSDEEAANIVEVCDVCSGISEVVVHQDGSETPRNLAGTVPTVRVEELPDGCFRFHDIRLHTIGPISVPKASDETHVHCPFSCDDGEGCNVQLAYSRAGKFLFCPACREGFIE